MKRSIGYTLLLLVVSGAAASAQEKPRAVPRKIDPVHVEAWGMPSLGMMSATIGFGSVEGLLRRKEELNLTSSQVAQIETIRKEEVARRQAESRDMIDLQSRMAAGLVDRTEYRDAMEKRSDDQRAAARKVRNRLEDILTDEQLDQIERMPFNRLKVAPGMIRRELPSRFDFDFNFDNFDFDAPNFDAFNFDFDRFKFDFDKFNFDFGDFDFRWPSFFMDSELAPLYQKRTIRGGIL